MENHEYQAPGPNDARSTCPGINVLANHGYLPRNGKDITPHQFIEAIYNGYNLTKVVGFILAHVGFYLVGKTWEGKVSLEDFSNSHDIVEHPMSLIRPDIGVGEGGKDYRKISPELLNSLFSEKNENDKLTRMSFAKQHIKRRDESLRDNPSFHGLSFFRKIQIFGEYALTLTCFPGTDDGRGEEIDEDTLKSIYQSERLPDNWKKAGSTIGFFQYNKVLKGVQRLADNLDKEKEKDKKND